VREIENRERRKREKLTEKQVRRKEKHKNSKTQPQQHKNICILLI
jgi:hypothetical protein